MSTYRKTIPISILAAILLAIGCFPSCANDSKSSDPAPVPYNAHQEIVAQSVSETAAIMANYAFAGFSYPTGWLITQYEDIPAGTPLRIRYLPDFDIEEHFFGVAISAEKQTREGADGTNQSSGDEALIEYNGSMFSVPLDYLLANLPDIIPQARYDVVYSYSSTSNCSGIPIPGVTNEKLPCYTDGMQNSKYWNCPQYVVPCAYRTAMKVKSACEQLAHDGFVLLVYDAYRPMTAQYYLSEAFENAYYADSAIQASVGDWPLEWYVANGPSGHNYGTDLDVGVCDDEGNPLPMPSSFDAFDESGHLTEYPLGSSTISPSAYRDEVQANNACMQLHRAFTATGFSELASEWWHFGDAETESIVSSIAGENGLDFVATI